MTLLLLLLEALSGSGVNALTASSCADNEGGRFFLLTSPDSIDPSCESLKSNTNCWNRLMNAISFAELTDPSTIWQLEV